LRMPRISFTGFSILGMMTVSPSRIFIISNISFGMIIPRLVPILRIFDFNQTNIIINYNINFPVKRIRNLSKETMRAPRLKGWDSSLDLLITKHYAIRSCG
jgi:hypothetical protein